MSAKPQPPKIASPEEVAVPGGHPMGLKERIDAAISRYGQGGAPIVPKATGVGRALVFVTAIMSFLACLALGVSWSAHNAAGIWSRDAAREVTVQIVLVEGQDIDEQVTSLLRLLDGEPGILRAKPYSREETGKMLEPWLGSGLDLSELPMPRMIALELDPTAPPDMAALARKISDNIKGATLDDHRAWQRQIATVAGAIQLASLVVLALMFSATAAIIVLATRGAMASNREIVDVLHLVGARQNFIAREFSHHFFMLGLKGGLLGGLVAALAFLAAQLATTRLATSAGAEDALIQAVAIGWEGYAGIAGVAAFFAVLSALTSRLTVTRFLRSFD